MNLKVGTGIYTGNNKLINRNCDARGDWSRWKGRRKVRSRQRRSLLVVLAAVLAILTGAWFALARSGAVRENGMDGMEVLTDLTADRIAGIRYQAAGSEPVAFTRVDGRWQLAGGAEQAAALMNSSNDQVAALKDGSTEQAAALMNSSNDQGAALKDGSTEQAAALMDSSNDQGAALKDGSTEQTATLKDDAIDQVAVSALASSLTGVRLYRTITDVTDLKQYGLDEPRYQVEITDTSGAVTRITVGAYNETVGKLYCLLGDDRETVYAVSPALAGSLTKTADEYKRNESES